MGRITRVSAALGCAALLLTSAWTEAVQASRLHAAGPVVRTVIVGVDGTIAAASASAKRLILVGTDDRTPQAGTTSYALIDTAHARIVARGSTTGQSIDLATIDDTRQRAYLLTQTASTDAHYNTTYALLAWALDLRTGRVLSRQTVLSGPHAEVPDALAVDPSTGDLLLAVHLQYQPAAELVQVNPTTLAASTQALPAAATALLVDGHAHRAIVSSTIGAYPATTTLTALRTGALGPSWSHAYTYALAASAMNDHAHQLWILAPGGRVTALDAATGRPAAQMHLAYTRPAAWTPLGFALDPAHNAAYAAWQEGYAGACHIDQATAHTGARRTIATFDCTTTGNQLLGLDPARVALVTGGAGTISTVNVQTGAVISTVTGVPPFATNHSWAQSVLLPSNGRLTVAVPNRVAHQDDETGATTAGAIVLASL